MNNIIIKSPTFNPDMYSAPWNFPIETQQLQTITGSSVPTRMSQAVVRTDTNEVLGVNGSKYKPIIHDDVVNSILDAVSDANVSQDYSFNVELYDNGAKLRGIIDFNDLTIEPEIGDHIRFQILFYNSYDGSWAFQQQAQGMRLWCLNGCTTADTVAKTWAKHTANVSVKGSASKIERGLDAFMNTKDLYQQWMRVSVTDDWAEKFFKYAICKINNNTSTFKWNERQLDNLMSIYRNETYSLGKNKWALYNACTYWATHTDDSSSPANTRRLREGQLSKAFKSPEWALVQ